MFFIRIAYLLLLLLLPCWVRLLCWVHGRPSRTHFATGSCAPAVVSLSISPSPTMVRSGSSSVVVASERNSTVKYAGGTKRSASHLKVRPHAHVMLRLFASVVGAASGSASTFTVHGVTTPPSARAQVTGHIATFSSDANLPVTSRSRRMKRSARRRHRSDSPTGSPRPSPRPTTTGWRLTSGY